MFGHAVKMRSVLSYFREYFDPQRPAPLLSHSAGRIARALHRTLRRLGQVDYFDACDSPNGMGADLAIGHFWSFQRLCEDNHFNRRLAFYSIADPDWMRVELERAARRFGVPFPAWDQPPPGFDNAATLALSDRVLVVGNRFTRSTFEARWQDRIRLLNYRLDSPFPCPVLDPRQRHGFVYPATHCDLRKGFMDVLRTWSKIPARQACIELVGGIRAPWDALLQRHNQGSMRFRGFLPSDQPDYWKLLRSCRFAFAPSYAEGQMGTLLEAVFSGCLPIATPACGLDERVLEWGIGIHAGDIEGQRAAVEQALAMTDGEWRHRAEGMIAAADHHHRWEHFERGVLEAIAEVSPTSHRAAV